MASEPVKPAPNSVSVLVDKLSSYEKWVAAKIVATKDQLFSTSHVVAEQRPQVSFPSTHDWRLVLHRPGKG